MISFMDQNGMWIILAVLVVIAIELFFALKPKKSTFQSSSSKEQSEILDEISQDGNDIYILFEQSQKKVAFVSENIERILGIRSEHVYADLYVLNTLLEKSEQWRIKKSLEEQSRTQSVLTEEIQVRRLHQEETLYMKLTIAPTSDKKYGILMLADQSKEQAIREDLKQQIAQVQAIDDSKTMFLSKMSHEIRTPMNGMLGMISLAKMSQKNQEYVEANDYLEKAEGLTQFLLSIINDILDMSRIESGKLELEQAEFPISDLADKLRTMFETTITEKGIAFSVEMQDFTIKNVIGDELRISQVLTNFLSNSSKFTSSGGHISLLFRQMEIIEDKVSIMLRVKDDGIGMSPEFLHRIFVPFEQEDSGIARKFGGSGLGMAISDNLVRQMGGQILVDSEIGKGSEFTVFIDLPIGTATEEEKQQQEETNGIVLEGRRLLMAEDNNINAIVATKLLSKFGLVLERAENGQEALDLFEKQEAGYYDAILMDIHMPLMDGWEATKQIRALDRKDASIIPIIALSADAFVEDKRHSVEIGMNGHVAKPIDYKELQQVLRSCLAESEKKMQE